jgi:hypothetical protein
MTDNLNTILFLSIILCLFLVSSGCTIPGNYKPANIGSTTSPQPVVTTISAQAKNISPKIISQYNIQSGIIATSGKPVYKIGQDNEMIFGITNNIDAPLEFGMGSPYFIEYFNENRTWEIIGGVGGTQAIWSLPPGESHTFPAFGTSSLRLKPGLYRIHIYGKIESDRSEPFDVVKEFSFEN